MPGIMVVAETRAGEVRDVSFELIGAALELGRQSGLPVSVALVHADAAGLAPALGSAGVGEVLTVASPAAEFEAHVMQKALEALIDQEQPQVVLAAHSVDSLGFGPALAAVKGLGFASDVTAVAWEDGPVATRGEYGDKLVADYDFPGKSCTLLLLRAGIFAPAEAGSGEAPAREIALDLTGAARTERVGSREAEAGDVDITKAEFLLSIGRGVEDEDDVERFAELAERLGAVLSASRPLVDAGWISNARQVGQSGKTVKPKVYLSLGISGAVQHLAGMRSSALIIAVNTDPEAPIFNVAHYGAVVDMFELADELERTRD